MRSAILNAVLKVTLISLGVFVVMVWGALAYRFLSAVLGSALVLALASAGFRSRRTILIASICVWIGVSVSPLELSFRCAPGPPHIVRLGMGSLSEAGLAAEKRGELVHGGCMVSGLEPKWVVVW